ncbi:TIGR03960 family B12-binding radical SAM protein [Treponema sp.]|uniref:TIGR03960 family B12-binding radical SAM protein n=1 Tax=Treponema sp. TaxID=166 RepID=UPI0025D57387|nr:TIGR03960 family B12-binding radical SAM protein [Treponema sp.]MCR5217517.1 TIGR03960 family B12-binding radical SAM protein [Treponema sp.]
MKLIKPLIDFGSDLNRVQSPSRYTGGEYGITVKPHEDNDSYFNFAVAFPDLYEIAMSNLAVKIIYNGLNAIEGVRCERVFSPDTDFEQLLTEKNIPLYTLETGMPLKDCQMIGFSIGYELGITQVLAMLEKGGVELLAKDRKNDSPIVIAGGCGVTNPAPFGDFFDAVFIGEAEDGLFKLVQELKDLKLKGADRSEMINHIKTKSFMWTKDNTISHKARRSVQADFGLVPSVPDWYPMPSVKTVQDHGVVEIMRGCPNGCRFCHAGVYYRPSRVKSLNLIIDEIDHLVFDCGYREISLNSLSSADFPDVGGLLDILNKRYEGYNVSFQLPSLKVNSMSLDILEKLSVVRKSGLTFAVETPDEMWQLSLNKEVYAQHLESIIKEAKSRGWSSAKFYFMIGLPLGKYFGGEDTKSEEEEICNFLIDLQAKTRIQCNVNIGVFIPKPHTAYQWVKQITIEEAQKKIDYVHEHLPRGKFKIGRHNFNATILEGLLSRGDARAGKVILSAYKKGARLDAWDEHLKVNMPLWEEAMAESGYDVKGWIYRDWDENEVLPWDSVTLGTSKAFFQKEWQKSKDHVLTKKCSSDCDHKCGICNSKENVKVHTKEEVEKVLNASQIPPVKKSTIYPDCNIPVLYRVIAYFTRSKGAEYTAYLAQVEIFHKAVLRSALPFVFTAGFNPIPRLEFATAMTLGIESLEETATFYLHEMTDSQTFIDKMNESLPEGFKITQAYIFPVTNLRKRETLAQGLWGGEYEYKVKDESLLPYFKSDEFNSFKEKYNQAEFNFIRDRHFTARLPVSDKAFRTSMEEFTGKKWYEICDIKKIHTLAKNIITGWTAADEDKWRNDNKNFVKEEASVSSGEVISFMKLYQQIAKINLDLINKRKDLTEIRKEFYKEHPEVKEKHNRE